MFHKVFSQPRFFTGQLLRAEDFQAEQTYHRDKARFRNLHLYGIGVISGLQIGRGQDRSSIIVSPGYAIDQYGRDICVPCDVPITLPTHVRGLSVWIKYAEAEAAPIPDSLSLLEPNGMPVNSQVEEGFEIDFALIPARTGGQQPALPPPSDTADAWLLLGVLLRKGNTWRLKPHRHGSLRKSITRRSTQKNRTINK